jgi:hypothetical protein
MGEGQTWGESVGGAGAPLSTILSFIQKPVFSVFFVLKRPGVAVIGVLHAVFRPDLKWIELISTRMLQPTRMSVEHE